ncbi:hypothetical protein HHI36_000549 [Cryptolaemus montrouzieri]|uniref:Uncharacterized protein n=1 Tax=Cryptolaemus montrouzieri TaxID=559131 RepID=A0ABD2P510_9CUCU
MSAMEYLCEKTGCSQKPSSSFSLWLSWLYAQRPKLTANVGRTLSCNEQEPPRCHCIHKGETVILDLGESNCQSLDPNSGSWCHNRQDWVAYFDKHPEYLMLD